MLIGEYTHTIDSKNRVSLPAKFRKELGKKVVITPGLENCLFVFSEKEWRKVSSKLASREEGLSFLRKDKRSFNRYMFGRAAEVSLDSIGRILVPDFLKEKLGLKDKAVFVGVEDRVEIWKESDWDKYKNQIEKEVEGLAESLGQSD